ncbi:MAG: hypothetical protein ACXWTH_09650 [Methylosarcina sp.]
MKQGNKPEIEEQTIIPAARFGDPDFINPDTVSVIAGPNELKGTAVGPDDFKLARTIIGDGVVVNKIFS